MSLLALLAAGGLTPGPGPDPDPDPDPPYNPGADTTPYAFPASAPYNAPQRALIPTYDGSGQNVHPSVMDAAAHGMTNWRGYRYWMGMTPYPLGQAGYENPSVVASHDGYTWVVPSGLTNPLEYGPSATNYNSDTELLYDPAGDRLVLLWRRVDVAARAERIRGAWSADGVTWNAAGEILAVVGADTKAASLLSPAIAQVSPSDWRMVTIGTSEPTTAPSQLRTAPSPFGPWSAPVTVTLAGSPVAVTNPWHFGMTYLNGVFYGLLDLRDGYGIVCCTSLDAQTWAVANPGIPNEPIRNRGGGTWDPLPYRATLQPHENGTHMRVWYSASGANQWWTGYTQMPLTEWPAPPA